MSLFQQLNEAATGAGLRFIVIGGHAVMVHGHQRGTDDADILIDKAERERWHQLIQRLGYRQAHDGGIFLQYQPLQPDWWNLDLMLVPPDTFQRLLAEVRACEVEGAAVVVPSLQHLMALKLHALKHARGLRVLKDMDDVAHLILANRVDVRSEWFRQLCLKHGTAELHERLLRLGTE